jgi:predicted Zn-dependent peptidase
MIINLKSENDLSGFYLVYEGSTNLEKPGWFGISHLMEHLMCKNFDHLQEDFDRDGISWNAYTSSNEIVFYIQGLDDKIEKWKYEYLDLMSNFNVNKEQFENERNIVLEEYMDYFNDQSHSHMLNLNRKILNDYDPIGLKSDLENMKFLDCLNFFELQYQNPSKIINVSKHKDFKNNLIDFKERNLDKEYKIGNYDNELELNNDFKDKSSILMLSDMSDKDNAYIHFINSMLSLGLSSPLYQEIREKRGLAYYVHCMQTRKNKQGQTLIATQTLNKNADTVIDVIKQVLNDKDKFLNKERLELVKEYYTVKKRKEEIYRHSNVRDWINPEGWSVYDILEDVNLDKLEEVYKNNFNVDSFYVSNDKKEF